MAALGNRAGHYFFALCFLSFLSENHVLCANFVKFGWPEIGKVVRCLPDKKNFRKVFRSRFWADRDQNLCHGQRQAMYSEFPKFHPNPFTSGEVIAERVNIVETLHKVFPIKTNVISLLHFHPENNNIN